MHLDQLNTSYSTLDGVPSTLLAIVDLGRIGRLGHVMGNIGTVHFECPQFVRLRADSIHELTVKVKDGQGQQINNHELPISATLEFC